MLKDNRWCCVLCKAYYSFMYLLSILILTLVASMFLGKSWGRHAWEVLGVAPSSSSLHVSLIYHLILEPCFRIISPRGRVEVWMLRLCWLFIRLLWTSLLLVVGRLMKFRYEGVNYGWLLIAASILFLWYLCVFLFVYCCLWVVSKTKEVLSIFMKLSQLRFMEVFGNISSA